MSKRNVQSNNETRDISKKISIICNEVKETLFNNLKNVISNADEIEQTYENNVDYNTSKKTDKRKYTKKVQEFIEDKENKIKIKVEGKFVDKDFVVRKFVSVSNNVVNYISLIIKKVILDLQDLCNNVALTFNETHDTFKNKVMDYYSVDPSRECIIPLIIMFNNVDNIRTNYINLYGINELNTKNNIPHGIENIICEYLTNFLKVICVEYTVNKFENKSYTLNVTNIKCLLYSKLLNVQHPNIINNVVNGLESINNESKQFEEEKKNKSSTKKQNSELTDSSQPPVQT